MSKGYFITGTDTGVGKTLVSAILTWVLQGCYWKPIQSGVQEEMSDLERVQQLTRLPAEHFSPSRYVLQAPLAPDQAAALENLSLDLDECQLPQTDKPLIVEGAGGVQVPINEQHNMLDLIKKLALPVIVVARGSLGTINHTLLTLESLRSRGLPIHGVVLNGPLNPANQKAIETWGQVRTLFHVPFFDTIDALILQRWIYDYTIRA
jgi:malonyl-CoA O-methyltransferase